MHFLLLFLFLEISSINSYEDVNENLDNQINYQSNSESLCLGTHLATGACSYVASISVVLLSFLAGDIASKNSKHLTGDASLQFVTLAIPSFIGLLTGAWIFYKAPQWTDTYVIKKKSERTFTQNMTTFFSRIVLSYPLGVIFGEICNKETKVNISPKFLFLYFLIS